MPVIYNKKVEYAYTDPGVKAHTLSWAEYQALSEDDKMNGDLYFIPDKQPEGNPSRIWTKLGTDPLTTQADDVSGAVNELNSSLIRNSIANPVQLDSYTSTNYICPSDGYVRCDCSAGTTAKAIADISGSATGSFRLGGWANGTYGMYVCYVKKGMKVRVVTLENSGHVWFYSLV